MIKIYLINFPSVIYQMFNIIFYHWKFRRFSCKKPAELPSPHWIARKSHLIFMDKFESTYFEVKAFIGPSFWKVLISELGGVE